MKSSSAHQHRFAFIRIARARARLAAMDVAFKRVNPGDDVPPPPKELKEWAANTAGGTAGGMAYGAARGYGAVDPAHAHLAAIVAKRHRWMRAAHEATMGGLRLGSFVAVFSAVQLGSASHRGAGKKDMWDTVAAGAITSGATGLALPGGLITRLQGAALGVVVGGGLCLPLGYAMQEIDKVIPEPEPSEPEGIGGPSGDGRPTRDLAGEVIAGAERDLRRAGPRRRRWFGWLRGDRNE